MERVNIAIVDQNQFFKLGLGLALQEGFLQNGVKAKITGGTGQHYISGTG